MRYLCGIIAMKLMNDNAETFTIRNVFGAGSSSHTFRIERNVHAKNPPSWQEQSKQNNSAHGPRVSQ